MSLKTALLLVAIVPLLYACSGMYVAGDAGPHHDTRNLIGAPVGANRQRSTRRR